MKPDGVLYCVTADLYEAEDIFKVGMTRVDDRSRLLYRYRNTLVNPTILAWRRVRDVVSAEREMLRRLSHLRLTNELVQGDRREIFSVMDQVAREHSPALPRQDHSARLSEQERRRENAFRRTRADLRGNVFAQFAAGDVTWTRTGTPADSDARVR